MSSEHAVVGHPADGNGDPIFEDGREIMLDLEGERARRSARKAQWRCVKNLWMSGKLRIVEKFDIAGRAECIYALIGSTFWLAFVITFIVQFRLLDFLRAAFNPSLPPKMRLLALAIAIPAFLLLGALGVYAVYRCLRWTKGNVAQVTLTSKGIKALLRDEQTFEVDWDRLENYQHGMVTVVRFIGGDELYCGGKGLSRMSLVLQLVEEHLFPGRCIARKRKRKKILIVLCIIFLIPFLLIPLLQYALGERPLGDALLCTTLAPSLLIGGMIGIYYLQRALKKAQIRYAQRKRRRQAAQRHSDHSIND